MVRVFHSHPPGNRADWAISCPEGSYTMNSGAVRRRQLRAGGRRLQGKGGGLAGGGMGNADIVQARPALPPPPPSPRPPPPPSPPPPPPPLLLHAPCQDLLTLTVTASASTAAPALPTTTLPRPCYLVDLTGTTSASTTAINLGPAPQINGNSFATATTYEASFAVGSVHTLSLDGIDAHPFHLHVNHYQLQTTPADNVGGAARSKRRSLPTPERRLSSVEARRGLSSPPPAVPQCHS